MINVLNAYFVQQSYTKIDLRETFQITDPHWRAECEIINCGS